MTEANCQICQKHRGEGPLVGPVIFHDDLVFVAHRAIGPLGYCSSRRAGTRLIFLT